MCGGKDGSYFYKYGDELRPFKTREIVVPYASGDTIAEKKGNTYFSHLDR
ncbi:MAG: hypothetical protein R2744_08750 [Bacteroidales bacterium]